MGAQPATVIEPRDGAIVSKATIRAAERLNVPQAVLADILGISEATVITHLENTRRKLNVANTTQAVVVALQTGELQPY